MIAVELVKQTRRPAGWLTLGVVAAVPFLLAIVIGSTRPGLPERLGNFEAVVPDRSGFSIPLIATNAEVLFLLPLAVAIFAGEAIAGEAAWGSLRYLLAGARSRTRVFWSKALVAAGFSVAAVAVTAAASLLAGVAAFGWQPLTVIDLEHTTAFDVAAASYAPAAALGLVAAAAGIVLVSMASTFGFGIFLSTLTRSPFAALAGAVGLGLVSRALDNVPGLSSLGPWLPLTDASTTQWTGLFVQPPNLGSFGRMALVQAAYLAVFVAAAWMRFARADVLT